MHGEISKPRVRYGFLGAVASLLLAATHGQGAWAGDDNWSLEYWSIPYDYQSPSAAIDYTPIEEVARRWRICASYPHLKDSYWLSVNYGMVEEARRLGVILHVVEAGGYPNLTRQISQIKECTSDSKADVLVVGTVSFDGLTETLVEIARRMPVVAVVNDIADPGISAKAGVSWITMGRQIGEFLADLHPAGSPTVKVAWFPGPKDSGWVPFVEQGFRGALADSSAEIVVTKWGDTGKEVQLILIEEALEERPDVDYIVGSAVTAEVAVSVLRARGLTDRIKVLADYFTHGIYRGIKRGRIMAAPTDFPVLQGRLGIDQAVRLLENKLTHKHAGPAIRLIDQTNVNAIGPGESLAPAWFKPTFTVE